MQRPKIIAVDFDGTICENKFPYIGTLKPDVITVLARLKQEGVLLILWTCRQGEALQEAITVCQSNGIEFDAVNENVKELPFQTSNKIYADIYLDDRSFYSTDWNVMYKKICNYSTEVFK